MWKGKLVIKFDQIWSGQIQAKRQQTQTRAAAVGGQIPFQNKKLGD